MHLSGDIEKDLGPKKDFSQTFSIGHWNLNSLVAHNFTKIALLKAYLPVQKFDIFCISETYLNCSITENDDSLRIPRYNLIRSDHPSNNKKGGVAIYYKHFLPLKLIDVNYLRESILFELQIGSKICNFISLYRSPSQAAHSFDSFLDNLKLSLDAMTDNNPFLVVAIGDFNARSSSWCINDKSNYEGTKIDCLATKYDLKQVINEPTYLLENSSYCIYLIFTSQPNLVMDAGVHPSLHANCHHQIVYPKFNLKIHYPPPYEREVWHFHKADINLIRREMNEFNWKRAFFNLDINEMVSVCNTTIKSIMANFIPHEIIICDDRDPSSINNRIKKLIHERNSLYKDYRKNNHTQIFEKLTLLQKKLHLAMEESKDTYYSNLSTKSAKQKSNPKTYWSVLKSFLNNKKVPCIPSLFHENKPVTDFREKAEIFNSYFSKQCSLVNSDSSLPCEIIKKTNNSLYSVRFSTEDILQIINNLDSNKAHGHDEISIRMLKICGSSVCRPLQIIYKSSLDRGKFPQEWKKANVVPVHKKNDKQLVKNYRPISLLPIRGKNFERILYNSLFNFLNQNDLISPAQSGFKPRDSCINQLLSITHEIYHSMDEGYEIRGVFLDISKAFDKVWHEGLVFKLNQNGISGNLLNIF